MTLGKRQNHEKPVLDCIYEVFNDLLKAIENRLNGFRKPQVTRSIRVAGFLPFGENDYSDSNTNNYSD
jgi:hypothetical protein